MNSLRASLVTNFAFNQSLRQRLAQNERTQWCANLEESEMAGLAWLIGEVGARHAVLAPLFDRELGQLTSSGAKLLNCRRSLAELARISSFGMSDSAGPAFSGALRQLLRRGKYTRWAEALSESAVISVFDLLAEIRPDLLQLIKVVDRNPLFDPMLDDNYVRGRAALAGLINYVVEDKRFTYEQAPQHLVNGMAYVREVLFQSMFTSEMLADAKNAEPDVVRWLRFGRTETTYLLYGESADGRRVEITFGRSK